MKIEKVYFRSVNHGNEYKSEEGCTVKREYGKTPNGNDFNGNWVYRDIKGTLIDFDQYRNDLAERNNIELMENT